MTTELKTGNWERLINYKVFRLSWLVNMPQLIKESVLFATKNTSQQMEGAKLVLKNVGLKEKDNMIKSILKNIQRFQGNLQRIGKIIIGKGLMKLQVKETKKIKECKLETNQVKYLEKKGFQNTVNVSFVEYCPIDKFIISNIQRRTLF